MTPPLPFDARARVADPGFTPSAAQLPALFEWLALAPKEEAPRVERVIARAGEAALGFALAHWSEVQGEARVRTIAVLGRLADARASGALCEALRDPEARVQRRAASALGRLPAAPEAERALLAAFEHAQQSERRAIVEALGKIGGEATRALFDTLSPDDAELARRVQNARLLLERRTSRSAESSIVTDRALPRPARLLVRCRAGLAELLAGELAWLGSPRVVTEELVELAFAGPFAALFRARTALEWGVRVELERSRGSDLPAAIARALSSRAAAEPLAAWTSGRPRFRLEFASGGHQRARVFGVVHALSLALPELVNDPRSASWTFVVVDDVPDAHLVLVPRGYEDPRFAYRSRDVPAASHPTVAAALALVSGVRPGEHVWDPFVGSGLELVERARLGPYASLTGSDHDARALTAARENLERAGVTAALELADATRFRPGKTTLILTNPPMGRRLARDRSLAPLLERFLDHAATVLEVEGRLVWLSPLPRLTRERARSSHLEIITGRPVDLGGFEVELQQFRKSFRK